MERQQNFCQKHGIKQKAFRLVWVRFQESCLLNSGNYEIASGHVVME